MAHIVSTSQPVSGALGDEWYNPSTNKLYKLVAVNGTNVQWLLNPGVTTGDIPESTNLYYTNSRVLSAFVSSNISVQGVFASSLSANTLTLNGADITQVTRSANVITNGITANIWNGIYTANVIETSGNLYFTNTRARSAFTAGRGIILLDDGTIKSSLGAELYNQGIDGGEYYAVTSSMSPAITFPNTLVNNRFVLRSIHVTNISDYPTYISSNVLYSSGNTAYLGNLIYVPVGAVVEFMDRTQIMQPGDIINLQGFSNNYVPTTGVLNASFTYETITADTTYVGMGQNLANSNTTIQIADIDQSDSILESVKFVNLKSYSIPIKCYWGNASGVPKAHFAYNVQVPPFSSMEVLQMPKLIRFGDKLFASYSNSSNADSISVFTSLRRSTVTNLSQTTANAVSGQAIDVSFFTSVFDGTSLYYTLE